MAHCAGQLRTLWRIACGLVAMESAIRGFEGMVAALAGSARRALDIEPVAESRVSRDELAVVSLLAALQHGASSHAERLAVWLVRATGRRELSAQADRLAGALAVAGRPLALCWLLASRPQGGVTLSALHDRATPARAFAHETSAPRPAGASSSVPSIHKLNSNDI